MFGRRNPDRPLDAPPRPPQSDLDLDLFDDLPDISPPARPEPLAVEADAELPPANPSWHTAPPAILGPSVTRLLQEAEASSYRQPAEPHQAPIAAEERKAPAGGMPVPPLPAAAVTQPLPMLVPAPAQPQAHTRPIAESVIGPDDFFDGRYRSERGVRIQGNARGSIESRQYIYVEAGAQVEADLSAEDITVSGSFRGKIVCRRRLEVTGSGAIEGQVQTALLVVHEGGAIDGELQMRGQPGAPAGDAAPTTA